MNCTIRSSTRLWPNVMQPGGRVDGHPRTASATATTTAAATTAAATPVGSPVPGWLIRSRALRMQEHLDGAAPARHRRVEIPADSPARTLGACGGAPERIPEGAPVARGVGKPELEHRLHQRHPLRVARERDA